MKDWKGNSHSCFVCNGDSNHSKSERESNDFYATDPIAINKLLEKENFSKNIWECACGMGHLVKPLESKGYIVKATDLFERGFGVGGVDFLKQDLDFEGDIITNPPYKYSKEFVEKALKLSNNKVAMFLKLTFLEGQSRRVLFEKHPPKTVYVFSKRIKCAKNGEFESISSSAVAYAWFVWEKDFYGNPEIKWI